VTEVSEHDGGYRCVEPELGRDLWRLDLPDLAPQDVELLKGHLAMCDACRLRQAMDRRFAAGLADGSLSLPSNRADAASSGAAPALRRSRRNASRRLVQVAGLALAASLALIVFLPPRPRDGGLVPRGGGLSPFLRPVEGEVVTGSRLRLSWREIVGASRYRLRIDQVGGDFRWAGETEAVSMTLPSGIVLPPDADFRAYLTPVPADLAPPTGLTVSFRSGGMGDVVRHRVQAAVPAVYGCALFGMLAICAAAILRLRRR